MVLLTANRAGITEFVGADRAEQAVDLEERYIRAVAHGFLHDKIPVRLINSATLA